MLVGNGEYGIQLSDDSDNNAIHHNSFFANGQNNLKNSQACDNGTYNLWYDETLLEGNYWSDYSGTGSYLISGSAAASDPYPFLTGEQVIRRYFPLLLRIGLFFFVVGLLVVVLFLIRRSKSV